MYLSERFEKDLVMGRRDLGLLSGRHPIELECVNYSSILKGAPFSNVVLLIKFSLVSQFNECHIIYSYVANVTIEQQHYSSRN